MATVTDPRAKVRTATPGSVADYHASSGDVEALMRDLAAYGVRVDEDLCGARERDEWERLAHLAGA